MAVASIVWPVLIGSCVFCTGCSSVTDLCPFWSEDFYVDGKCYKPVAQITCDGNSCLERCQALGEGAVVAEITTSEQERVVNRTLEFVKKVKPSIYYMSTGAYLDGSTYRWPHHKTELASTSRFWKIGEPGRDGCVIFGRNKLVDVGCGFSANVALLCQTDSRPVLKPCYFWDDAVYVQNKCFRSFSTPLTWSEAMNFCRRQGPSATLAELLSTEEKKMVGRLYTNTSTQSTWLGLSDLLTEGQFVWTSTNISLPSTSSWWSTGSPSHNTTLNCVALIQSSQKLDDFSCNDTFNFTCQTTISNPCDEFMPEGAEYYQGRCYLYVNTATSWEAAQEYCRTQGSYLAEPWIKGLQEYVSDLTARYSAEPVWLGGAGNFSVVWWATTGDVITGRTVPSSSNCYLQAQGSTWNCTNSSQDRTFVCEQEIGDPCELYLPGALYDRGQCLKYFDTPLNWSEAQNFCQDKNSHLIEVDSQIRSDVLNTYLRYLSVSTAWIGGQGLDIGYFQWVTSGQSLSYSLLLEDYGTVYSGLKLAVHNASVWVAEDETTVHPFVCQTGVRFGQDAQTSVTTSFPQVADLSDLTARLEVNNDAISHRVWLQVMVQGPAGESLQDSSLVLKYQDIYRLDIDPRIMMNSSGVYTGYVRVTSSAPVTATLHVTSSSAGLESSSLLLPDHLITDLPSPGSAYFLVSGVSQNNTEDVISATSLQTPGKISLTFPQHSRPGAGRYRELELGDFLYSPLMKISVKTGSAGGSAYLRSRLDMDGVYLSSETKSSVLLGGFGEDVSGQPRDSTLDHILPLELIDSQYITFPSFGHNTRDFLRLVAVEDGTDIQMSLTQSDNNVTRIHLDKVGEVADVTIPGDKFLYLRGSSPFYAFKFSKSSTSGSCLTALFPSNLWKSMYSFHIPAGTNTTEGYLAVVVPTIYSSLLNLRGYDILFTCRDVPGSDMSGCSCLLPANKYSLHYHLDLRGQPQRFAAYLTVSSATSIACHHLGIQNRPKVTYVYDHLRILTSLLPPCDLAPVKQEPTSSPPSNVTEDHYSSTTSVMTVTEDPNSSPTSSISGEYNCTPTLHVSTAVSDTTDVTMTASTSLPATGRVAELITVDSRYTDQDIEDLWVDIRDTSAYKRTKISVPDQRVSSITLGSLGIICICVAVGLIALGDVINLCRCRDRYVQSARK